MPLIVKEMQTSRRVQRGGQGSGITRIYDIEGTNDPEYVLATGFLPAHLAPHPTLPYVYVDEVVCEPIKNDPTHVRAIVKYQEWPLGLTPNGENWTWDLIASQQKIYSVPNSSYQIYYPADEDIGTAIGSDGEKTEGVDVYRPQVQVTATKIWPSIYPEGRLLLEAMIGHTNSGYWMDYLPGEALFTGSRIRRQADGMIQITYSFMIARYKGIQQIEMHDGSLLEVDARPWDYIWFRFLDKPENEAGGGDKILKRGIRTVAIAQVYDSADFSLFGLVGPYG